MLKMFLRKEIDIKYVAVKSKKDKFIMKNTAFFTCVEIIIKDRRQISNLSKTDKEIVTALSNVLSNAVVWYVTKKDNFSFKRKYEVMGEEDSLQFALAESYETLETLPKILKIQSKLQTDLLPNNTVENTLSNIHYFLSRDDDAEEYNEEYLLNFQLV